MGLAAMALVGTALLTPTMAEPTQVSHMYEANVETDRTLPGKHHVVFRGQEGESYNNHAYIARHDGRFWAIWSNGERDGGHTGQHVRFATSEDGRTWSRPGSIMPRPADGYFIARGLWVRDGELLALVARCTGETRTTEVEALEAYRWNRPTGDWQKAGAIGQGIINNYAPLQLADGRWLMPYREGELNRVDGVMIGGVRSIGDWDKIRFPGEAGSHLTEANAIIRADGSIAIHIRDNNRSGFLYRSVSEDGGRTFTEPTRTDFPDCRCKHYCMQLSTGRFILVNNPRTRDVLQVAGSPDGKVFTQAARLRWKPVPLRHKGHDKGGHYTYPHAIEHDAEVYFIYAVNRDDIAVTRVSVEDLEAALGGRD